MGFDGFLTLLPSVLPKSMFCIGTADVILIYLRHDFISLKFYTGFRKNTSGGRVGKVAVFQRS